jgi:hypothetical protein
MWRLARRIWNPSDSVIALSIRIRIGNWNRSQAFSAWLGLVHLYKLSWDTDWFTRGNCITFPNRRWFFDEHNTGVYLRSVPLGVGLHSIRLGPLWKTGIGLLVIANTIIRSRK